MTDQRPDAESVRENGGHDDAQTSPAATGEVPGEREPRGRQLPTPEVGHQAISAESVAVPKDLLESIVDWGDCHFDHHGGCQAHGYLDLEPGEICPQEEIKMLLRGERTHG